MTEVVYVSDSMKQSIDFINDLISDLQRLGIEIVEHSEKHNFIIVGNIEIKGICVYESYLHTKMQGIKYYIDGIDMRNYKDASKRNIDVLMWRIRYTMQGFKRDTKQLNGKDELIKILMENNAEVAK